MPPQLPKPEPPATQATTDEPRSPTPTRPARATKIAGSEAVLVEVDVHWADAATRALAPLNATKRALNLAARHSIRRALREATPLYRALVSHLKVHDKAPFQLNLMFTDDADMRDINRETRGKDKPTDVLSFPVWEGETFPFPPDQTEVMLGDAIISIETAARQAAELKHDLRAEIAFLAVHGALHLLGYDHGTDSQRRKMFALQDEIVARVREEKGF